MTTLQQAGMTLTNALRPFGAGVEITLADNNGVITCPFMASSPPIGHPMLTEAGLSFSNHERVFFWELKCDGERLLRSPPERGMVITVTKDKSKWRILPQNTAEDAWRWHGSDQSAVMVVCKKDDE